MFLIIGLGNPGKKYEKNRHNSGFMAVDFVLDKKTKWIENKKLKSLIKEMEINEQKVVLVKPQTFMNNSGVAVLALTKKYKIKPENIIMVYDELDLPFGTIRVKLGGSAAGHNGIKSIIEKLGTDKFWRIRIGISNEKREVVPADKFVLANFSKEELKDLKEKILLKAMEEIKKIVK
ncbi:MAG TPA: aminoacyl-tRNA hydrolase [bacterium]|nr:aminoacyl-tRNA hydrolase [bacterium]HPL95242.1 aminoacyl-tRNA hydrolase [bacterium]